MAKNPNPEILRALGRAASEEHRKLMHFAAHPKGSTAEAWHKACNKRTKILNNCLMQFFAKENDGAN